MAPKAREEVKANELKRQSLSNVGGSDGLKLNPLASDNSIILKGHLCKKNWYGAEQKRFFELYQYGELKYYKDKDEGYEYKGSITLNKDSQVTREGKGSLKIHCEQKNKDYLLLQGDANKINFAEEKKKGYKWFVDDWVKEIYSVIEYLKYKDENGGLKRKESGNAKSESD